MRMLAMMDLGTQCIAIDWAFTDVKEINHEKSNFGGGMRAFIVRSFCFRAIEPRQGRRGQRSNEQFGDNQWYGSRRVGPRERHHEQLHWHVARRLEHVGYGGRRDRQFRTIQFR